MAPNGKLERRLSAFDCVMMVAGGVVGVGIFINPSEVARTLQSPSAILLAWLVGGLAAMMGGITYSKLGRWLPQAGGQYVFLREAYHPGVAFLYGWTLLLAIFSGISAAVSLTFARYAVVLFPSWAGSEKILAALLVVALSAVNYRGVRLSGTIQNLLALTKLASILFLVFLALRATASPGVLGFGEPPNPSTFFFGLLPVLFTYGGWYTLTFLAAEVRRPEVTIPVGLVGGIAIVIAIYAMINTAYMRVLSVQEIAQSPAVAAAMASRLLGPAGAGMIAIFIVISAPAVVNVVILAGSRAYYAMARDGVFFNKATYLHPRYGVPVYSIVAQAAWSIVLILSQTYGRLLQDTMFAEWTFFAMTGASVFIFAARHRGFFGSMRERLLISASALVFAAVATVVVASTLYRSPQQSIGGLALILAGAAVYYFWRRRARRAAIPAIPVETDSTPPGQAHF